MWNFLKKKKQPQQINYLDVLSEELGNCSGGLCSVLKNEYNLTHGEMDYAILENYGFLLANIHFQGGLSNDEVKQCIMFFSQKYGKENYEIIANSSTFYSQMYYRYSRPGKQNDTLFCSIICYNLRRPRTWDDFSESLHIGEVNFLSDTALWLEICAFLKEVTPKRINPILEKL